MEVEVNWLNNGLFMSVSDNGHNHSHNGSLNGGNGLRNMNRRAKKMDGELKIHNHGGYRIELMVPKAYKG